MKISFDTKEFAGALKNAMRAVLFKATVPILECVLIEAEEDEVSITSNDQEVGINIHIQANVYEPGMIAVKAKTFNEIISRMPDVETTITTDEKLTVTIQSGPSEIKISGLDPSEFQKMPDVLDGFSFTVPAVALKTLIAKTAFCALGNDINKVLTGVFLETNGDVLRGVAIDGVRVAIYDAKIDKEYEKRSVIVPRSTLSDTWRILSQGYISENIDICFAENHASFDFGNVTIVTRLIEGEYLQYEKLLARTPKTKIYVGREELTSCVQRCSVVISQYSKRPVVFDIAGDVLTVNTKTKIGSATEDVGIEKEGEDLMIGFDPKNLLECISAVDEDEVEIRFIDKKSPAYITKDDSPYTYIVLPVNI